MGRRRGDDVQPCRIRTRADGDADREQQLRAREHRRRQSADDDSNEGEVPSHPAQSIAADISQAQTRQSCVEREGGKEESEFTDDGEPGVATVATDSTPGIPPISTA